MELKNVEIIKIGEIKTFANDFKKIDFVVKTQDQYPQTLLLQAIQKTAENVTNYNKVGQFVDVSLNLKGREWADPKTGEIKYFNSLEAWKVFKAEGAAEPQVVEAMVIEEEDDLPF